MKKTILLVCVFMGYVFISHAQKKYAIGLNPALGGYVFKLSADKMHGLVAETKDIPGGWSWYAAEEIMQLKCVHTPMGAKFTDWRLPTKDELNLMISQAGAIRGFTMEPYWSSTELETDKTKAYTKDPYMPFQGESGKMNQLHVRAVREF